ncbi:MAG: SH3 domain-containing protein [Rhizobiaceae bacterium]
MKKIFSFLALLMLLLPQLAHAQDIARERLRFAPGQTSTTVEDRIIGREIVDYAFDARRGQTISVQFLPTSQFAFFNLLAPGGEPLFVGQDVGNPGRFDARLGVSGTYTIRVYLVRAEARRGGRAGYQLSVALKGGQVEPIPAPAPDDTIGVVEEVGPNFYVVAGLAPGEGLNMRRGPSTTQAVIIKLPNGVIVRNLGCRKIGTSRWCQVQNPRTPSQLGWVNGRFLREAGAPRPEVQPEPIDPGIPEDGGPDFYVVAGISQGDALSLRTGPARTQALVARFPNGVVLQNLGCRSIAGVRWCQVQNPNNRAQRGWVNGRFLREAAAPRPGGDDALVPATKFNATGEIDCTVAGSRVSSCPFGVVRRGQDEATVFITLPNNEKRVLEFDQGRVRSMSAVSGFSFRQEGDEYFINVNRGQERFSIPDAVINGG